MKILRYAKALLYVAIAVIALGAVALFSTQNAAPVTVYFYNWRFSTSLALVVFLSIVAGAVITTLFFLSIQLARSIRRRGRKAAPEQREIRSSSPDSGQGSSA
jgi:uncharacterized integral membrane protein